MERTLDKLKEELVSLGYREGIVAAAVERAKGLSREVALKKVGRPTNQRPVFCLPYNPRLLGGVGGGAAILWKFHRALLARDVDDREYLPEPLPGIKPFFHAFVFPPACHPHCRLPLSGELTGHRVPAAMFFISYNTCFVVAKYPVFCPKTQFSNFVLHS